MCMYNYTNPLIFTYHSVSSKFHVGLNSIDPNRFRKHVEYIAEQIKEFYDHAGGFGTFLIVTGKDWATREKRALSMTRFMKEVAPQISDLVP